MTDPPRYPDSKPHTTLRWVKVFGIIALVVVLLVVVMLLIRGGGGGHGPGRHTGGGDTPTSSVTDDHAASGGGTHQHALQRIHNQAVQFSPGPEAEVVHRGTRDPGQ